MMLSHNLIGLAVNSSISHSKVRACSHSLPCWRSAVIA
jgi:hypothetical protein